MPSLLLEECIIHTMNEKQKFSINRSDEGILQQIARTHDVAMARRPHFEQWDRIRAAAIRSSKLECSRGVITLPFEQRLSKDHVNALNGLRKRVTKFVKHHDNLFGAFRSNFYPVSLVGAQPAVFLLEELHGRRITLNSVDLVMASLQTSAMKKIKTKLQYCHWKTEDDQITPVVHHDGVDFHLWRLSDFTKDTGKMRLRFLPLFTPCDALSISVDAYSMDGVPFQKILMADRPALQCLERGELGQRSQESPLCNSPSTQQFLDLTTDFFALENS
jgi:hypothetical protein